MIFIAFLFQLNIQKMIVLNYRLVINFLLILISQSIAEMEIANDLLQQKLDRYENEKVTSA